MIIYDLECDSRHRFEGWFRDVADYENQLNTHLLVCPLCESRAVHKVPSASYINTGIAGKNHAQTPAAQGDPITLLRKLHHYVEQNFEQVGDRFAEEARRIHYGESEERGIAGTASGQQVRELNEEGIKVVALPPKPPSREKLN